MIYDIIYEFDKVKNTQNKRKYTINENINELTKITDLDIDEFNNKINLLFEIIKQLKKENEDFKEKYNTDISKVNESIEKCSKIIDYVNKINFEKLI